MRLHGINPEFVLSSLLLCQSFSVAEDADPGFELQPAVVASNPEQGQFLVYSIESGALLDPNDATKGDAFTIGVYDGKIRVAGQLDHELKSSYTLQVKVLDNGSPALSTTASMTVTVSNSPEQPSISPQERTVAENSAVGTLLSPAVVVSDPDVGDTVSLAILDGNDGDAFELGSDNVLKVSAPEMLDYESRQSFALTLRATDSAGLFADGTVTVRWRVLLVALSAVLTMALHRFGYCP